MTNKNKRNFLKKRLNGCKNDGQGGPRINPFYYLARILNKISPIKPEVVNKAWNKSKDWNYVGEKKR